MSWHTTSGKSYLQGALQLFHFPLGVSFRHKPQGTCSGVSQFCCGGALGPGLLRVMLWQVVAQPPAWLHACGQSHPNQCFPLGSWAGVSAAHLLTRSDSKDSRSLEWLDSHSSKGQNLNWQLFRINSVVKNVAPDTCCWLSACFQQLNSIRRKKHIKSFLIWFDALETL